MIQPHYIDREAVALLPCPFCGGTAKIISPGSEGGVDVGCLPNPGCGARLRFFGNAKSAARYWNRRAPAMEAVAWREALEPEIDGIVRLAVSRAEKLWDRDPIKASMERTNIIVDTSESILQALLRPDAEGKG